MDAAHLSTILYPLIAIPTAIGFAIIGLKASDLPWGSLGYVNILPRWRSPPCRC